MQKIVTALGRLLILACILGLSAFFLLREIQETLTSVDIVKNGTPKTAVIQKLTRIQTRGRGRYKAGRYAVEVSFEENGEIINKSFKTKKYFEDNIGGYFEDMYRIGNKISIIVGTNGEIVHYSERKSIIFDNVKELVLTILLFLVMLFCFFYEANDIFQRNKRKTFYIQDKNHKLKNLDIYSVRLFDYLKKIENGELICFGFTVGKMYCEYGFEKNVYYERINDGNEEVTHEITERGVIERRIEEISRLAKKYMSESEL